KTGTVTEGQMAVSDVTAFQQHSANDVLVAAAAVELGSEHPIAAAIVQAGTELAELPEVTEFVSTAGGGVIGTVAMGGSQQRVAAGRSRSEEHTSELQSRFDLVCRLL